MDNFRESNGATNSHSDAASHSGDAALAFEEPSRPSLMSALAPSLMLLHQTTRGRPASAARAPIAAISDEDTTRFIDAVIGEALGLDGDAQYSEPAAMIKAARAAGATTQDVAEAFFVGAARAIDEHWENDTLSLVDVAIALCRLHELLRNEIKARVDGPRPESAACGRLLVTNFNDDQHSFGAALVEQAFREAGWCVANMVGVDERTLTQQVSREYFDMIALSATNDFSPHEGEAAIATLRRASVNKAVKVFVGGRAFTDDPSLVGRIGADGWARDAYSAPQLAASLIESHARHT